MLMIMSHDVAMFIACELNELTTSIIDGAFIAW